ncbi:hypothetical protein [Flavobacterium sp.]|uniref:hypothetical protein n=1 Tax=Flavobacterium sp. TaxID=239 RepID=UPI0025E142CD|nr:hypothetical protein [Flavobacterium sp.]
MNFKKYTSLFIVFIAAIGGLIVHKAVTHFIIPAAYEDHFVYSTPVLYSFFMLFSLIIVFILMKVKEVMINSVGYAFFAFTTLKMAMAYLLLRPIIQTHLPKTPAEKMNFFVVFIYFLAIETILTIRILNNKQ